MLLLILVSPVELLLIANKRDSLREYRPEYNNSEKGYVKSSAYQ
jgi:hypothetical protein